MTEQAIGTALLAILLLGWAALADLARCRIPRPAGYGMLGLAAGTLAVDQRWVGLAAFLLTLWCSRGGVWWRLLVGVLAVSLPAAGWQLLPLWTGLLAVGEAFRRGWLGGGDAQLALGLVALRPERWVVLVLAAVTVLAGVLVMVARGGGLVGGWKRMLAVSRRLGQPPDGEAVRSPYGVVVLTAGVLALWALPVLEVW